MGMGYLSQQKKMLPKLFLGRFIWQPLIVLNLWIDLSTLCEISILSSYIYQDMPYLLVYMEHPKNIGATLADWG